MEIPKQKSEILIDKYLKLFSVDLENTISQHEAVECAKIAVNVILYDVGAKDWENEEGTDYNYWQEVLNELNKL